VTVWSASRLDPEQRRKWSAARVWAAHQAPYLATALLSLEPVFIDQSAAVVEHRFDLRRFPADPAWHVYVDLEVLHTTEVREIGFWVLHQVTHLLRHHPERTPVPSRSDALDSRTPEQQRWNLAGDAEIDDDLVAGDVTLPAEAITPAQLQLPDNWTAEQYWDALSSETASRQSDGDCGSGCDGQPRPWDSGRPGLSGVNCRLLERDVARRIREHQRRRGTMPAGWQRWADDVLEPSVSWQRVLASAVRSGIADVAGRVDFTYRRPSRRASAVPDVVLPSLRQPLPHVAMVLDTSGSMSDQMLGQALAEVGGVLRSLGIARRSLRVVCCDAQAYEAQRVLGARDVRLLGGGGTDMSAGLKAASELRPRPDLIIVLTDGHTPWPPHSPERTSVLVGLMDSSGHTPGWAKVIDISPPILASGW
jgi:predicted metal-dependent peptidase